MSKLVDRARMMQGAFEGFHAHINERFEAPGRQAFAFRLTGRHVGPLETPLGELAPTGRQLGVDGMGQLPRRRHADRVSGVWAIADFLGLLMQAGAIAPFPRS